MRVQRPLLESGTLGTQGHVQVIVPHITENYGNQGDPPEKEVPFCTLKSFPSTIEHTIQWARDRFENIFSVKAAEYQKYLMNPYDYVQVDNYWSSFRLFIFPVSKMFSCDRGF